LSPIYSTDNESFPIRRLDSLQAKIALVLWQPKSKKRNNTRTWNIKRNKHKQLPWLRQI